MGAFMEKFTRELDESGRLVETRALTDPAAHPTGAAAERHPGCDRRAVRRDGGGARRLLDRRRADFDRATELAGRLSECPAPAGVAALLRRRAADHGVPGGARADRDRRSAAWPSSCGRSRRRCSAPSFVASGISTSPRMPCRRRCRGGRAVAGRGDAGRSPRLADHRRVPPPHRSAPCRAGPPPPRGVGRVDGR